MPIVRVKAFGIVCPVCHERVRPDFASGEAKWFSWTDARKALDSVAGRNLERRIVTACGAKCEAAFTCAAEGWRTIQTCSAHCVAIRRSQPVRGCFWQTSASGTRGLRRSTALRGIPSWALS